MSRRALLLLALLLVLVGIGTSAYLTHLHVLAHTDVGFTPACDINNTWQCSTIALSRYAVAFGVPVAVWGLVGYAAFLALIVWGYRAAEPGRRQSRPWPSGLLWLLASATLLYSLYLGFVAEAEIGALCLGCVMLYGVNLGLFVTATALLRHDRGAVRRDLLGLGRNRPVHVLVVGGLVAALALVMAYPKYWDRPLQAECEGVPAGIAGDGSCWIGARTPQLEITEFSDYRCPYCRRAHDQMRQLVQAHPDRIRLIHKHYPLDVACNPVLRQQLHEGACQMARMAYCAGAQGKFWVMNDKLFAVPHTSSLDAAAAAAEVGLDVARFMACIDTPEAVANVDRDVQEGIALNITGTPTFLIEGRTYVGTIPDDVLRPYLSDSAAP